MRLTLRTLLAYLDGILEPEDSLDLGRKIEESEYATNLVHRIRDVMRRLRLGAPRLTDEDPKFDPNTVAEYLDNTLPTDQITDFEKVCLESDVHLAEVAASHQILTLVLGEPAEVDPESRQRMYQLKDAQSGGHSAPPPPPVIVAAGAATTRPVLDLNLGGEEEAGAGRKPRPKPTVPEYLRESRKRPRWVPMGAAVVLLVCLTLVALVLLRQFEPGTPLGDLLVRWGVVEGVLPVAVADKAGAAKDKTEIELPQAGAAAPESEPPSETKPETAPSGGATSAPAKDLPAPPAQEPPSGAAKLPEKEPSQEKEFVDATPIPKEFADKSESPLPGPPPQGDVLPKPEPEKLPAPPGDEPAPKPAGELPKPATKSPVAPGPLGEVGKEPEAKSAGEPAPMPPQPLGRLMSTDQVLLFEDPVSGWTRVAYNQMLHPQQLLALPTYRARVALTSGVTLEIAGGTRLELIADANPQEPQGLRIFYGRVVLMPLAKAGTKLRVAFGDRTGTLTFTDPESTVAFEVRRVRPAGSSPENDVARVAATLYVAHGGATWEDLVEGDGSPGPISIAALQRLAFDGPLTAAPASTKEMPRWIAAELMSGLDRRASPVIGQALQTAGPARVGLMELRAARPQKEVKWLALRCLGYVNQFHDMTSALNDPMHRLDWPDYIDELRAAVARDPETAVAVREALEKQYPQQAAQLYRMLWGYSDKDLEAGEDENLVKALDDDLLAVRVLSSWNLKDITGLGQYYQPEQTAARRQQSVRRWRQRLEAKEIRLKSPEEKAGAAAGENAASPAAPLPP